MKAQAARVFVAALLALPTIHAKLQPQFSLPDDDKFLDESGAALDDGALKELAETDRLVRSYINNRSTGGKAICQAKYAGFFASWGMSASYTEDYAEVYIGADDKPEQKLWMEKSIGGNTMPMIEEEVEWDPTFRAILYFFGLLWAFLAVGIISDKFMLAIEVITAQEKTIQQGDATVSVKVWNATVANLTLMALGSSAPEILLSVIETTAANYYSGELGPSTIVGSAAFNLFMILAVCVTALPAADPPETRKIDELGVYCVTAFFSVFAYVLLLAIVSWISPNVIEIWEGVLVLLCFPILVVLAYGADRGWFSAGQVVPDVQQHLVGVDGATLGHAKVAELMKRIDKSASAEEAAALVAQLNAAQQKPSRAQLRMNAIRSMTGQKTVGVKANKINKKLLKSEAEAEAASKPASKVDEMTFEFDDYAVLESDKKVVITMVRSNTEGTVSVDYYTEDETATAGKDYVAVAGTCKFAPGEAKVEIPIEVIDDEEVEVDESFVLKLKPETYKAEGCPCILGKSLLTRIKIIDDDEPGELGFEAKNTGVTVSETGGFAKVIVSRSNGSNGSIACKLKTEAISATAGKDFEAVDQEVVFEANAITKTVEIPIIDNGRYACNNTFKAVLSEPRCVGQAGVEIKTSEHVECVVTIVADENTKKLYDDVSKLAKLKLEDYKLGTATWAEQFREALCEVGEDDDEDGGDEDGDGPGTIDYVMHVITLPWKLVFALVPPTDYWGGKVCFVVSLAFIGVVTCLIGDLAAILGCLIGLPDSITAITLVALGTSLPDTFASKAAAVSDDNADASIGNVTGSNGVNVFLGIGLPWAMAAFYWSGKIGSCDEGTESLCDEKLFLEWKNTKSAQDADGRTFGQLWEAGELGGPRDSFAPGFVVEGGTLGISVSVFVVCAGVAISTLYYRRVTYGAELGGPKGGFLGANQTSYLFTTLWIVYIASSCIVVFSSQ